MTLKISNDYKEQKEYTENVSHEIQTPLAIISAKAWTIEILMLNDKSLVQIHK